MLEYGVILEECKKGKSNGYCKSYLTFNASLIAYYKSDDWIIEGNFLDDKCHGKHIERE
jgi:hypothetical protein